MTAIGGLDFMVPVDEENNVWRGPRPNNLADLVRAGIKRVIDLESGVYEYFHENDPLIHQFPVDFGLQYYHMPCSDVTPPEDWVVEKVLKLTADTMPTYIHCLSGVDRTGFVCAAYRMQVNKWTYQAAVAEWKALGRHSWFFYWEYKLKARWELKK